MLAIVASDKCYVNVLLEKLTYSKEESPNKSEVYKCNYKEHKFIILVSGYGKVNIGSSLRYICDKYPIKVIISIGTCGSITDYNGIFSALIPLSSLEFDVDFTPIGYFEGQIPKISKALYKTNDDLVECLKKASNMSGVSYSNDLIVTSDMFVSNYTLSSSIRKEYNAGAVDCESGSIGQFCFINDIAYAILKVVSNFANNNGVKQYNLYDDEACMISQKITYKFLKEFYDS